MALSELIDAIASKHGIEALRATPKGLPASIRAMCRAFRDSTGIDAEVRFAGSLPALSPEVEAALYWVVHEAFGNVERYARATGVVVTLSARNEQIELTIRDDGVGLSARQGPDGRMPFHFAVRSMIRCLEQVGGRLQLSKARPRGLVIRALAPSSTFTAALPNATPR